MNKLHTHFKKDAEEVRLTKAEKNAMRSHLYAAMSFTPAPSPYVRFFAPRSLAFLSVLILLIGSGGTAYAAKGSLPGEILYPVKVRVLEPLKIALATTPAAKAEVNADIAGERVKEAQTLAVEGRLNGQTAQELSDSYKEHAAVAIALAGGSQATTTDAVAATSTRPYRNKEIISAATSTQSALAVRLQASLALQGQILAGLDAEAHKREGIHHEEHVASSTPQSMPIKFRNRREHEQALPAAPAPAVASTTSASSTVTVGATASTTATTTPSKDTDKDKDAPHGPTLPPIVVPAVPQIPSGGSSSGAGLHL